MQKSIFLIVHLLASLAQCRFRMIAAGRCAAQGGKEYQVERPVDCGDDALLMDSQPGFTTIGVADGVGSWRENGIDPAQYSWSLMQNIQIMLKRLPWFSSEDIVKFAQQMTFRQFLPGGSATLNLAKMSLLNGHLDVLNIGDASLLIIRDSRIVYQTPTHKLGINKPCQISYDSTKMPRFFAETIELQHGDIVVSATDGLFDNLPLTLIQHIVNNIVGPYKELLNHPTKVRYSHDYQLLSQIGTYIAIHLVKAAHNASRDPTVITSFGRSFEVPKRIPIFKGGKPDDITVIASVIVEEVEKIEIERKKQLTRAMSFGPRPSISQIRRFQEY